MSSILNIGQLLDQKDLGKIESEPNWLTQIRNQAWTFFKKLPFESDPNMLNFLEPKKLESFEFSPGKSIIIPKQSEIQNADEKTIQIKNTPESWGISFPENSTQKEKDFLEFSPLLLAHEDEPKIKQIFTMLIEKLTTDKLVALIMSSFEWGSYIKVNNDSTITSVVKLEIQNTSTQPKPHVHIIDIGNNANVSFDLQYNSDDHTYDHSLTILVTGSNAHVNILVNDKGKLNRKTNRGFISTIGKDSTLNFAQVQVNGSYIRQRSEFYFTGEGADLVEVACLRGHEKQEYDFYSSVYHLTPRCTSNTIARGVNDDESTTFFKGKVDIGKDGAKVNTDLNLRGLLLSKKSRFHALPAMEVINNNVIATHGAAVSKIDPEQIFYFQTRGINKDDAEHLIAAGYFDPAVSKMRSESLKEKARSIIEKAVDEHYA